MREQQCQDRAAAFAKHDLLALFFLYLTVKLGLPQQDSERGSLSLPFPLEVTAFKFSD